MRCGHASKLNGLASPIDDAYYNGEEKVNGFLRFYRKLREL